MAVKHSSNNILMRAKTEKLRELVAELPEFCFPFFIGIETQTTIQTRISYAYDLGVFFDYMLDKDEALNNKTRKDIIIDDIKKISPMFIERYMESLNAYERNDQQYENHDSGKKRKLSSLSAFFKYYFKKQLIPANIVELVDKPKIREKNIIRLEADEVALLLDAIESGEGLTSAEKRFHAYTKERDFAIVTLMLGTGIRISECVGLDRSDVDFRLGGIRIIRKGQKESVVYFGDEVEAALKTYLKIRNGIEALEESANEDALFLSLQKKRIGARAVQKLMHKYAQIVTPLKHITPHKLRSTYGTELYRETGDIYLVADVLGHSDVNTTRKHYASMADESRRMAARAVRLRDNVPVTNDETE